MALPFPVVTPQLNKHTIQLVRVWMYRHKMLAHEDLKNAQVLIFANKQDVKEALTSAEISKSLNLTKLKGISWHIQVGVLSLN